MYERRGKEWSANPIGSRVVFYGDLRNVASFREAKRAAAVVRDAVKEAVPEASVIFNGAPDGFMVAACIHADDIAVPRGGPMHRKAIEKVRRAMQCSMDSIAWLESEKEVTS